MIEQNAFTIIFSIFLFCSARDVLFDSSAQEHQEAIIDPSANHLHPHMHESGSHQALSAPAINTIKIQYCHSCGYRQAYDDVAKMLQQHYPELKVEGVLHQPGWFKNQIVTLLFVLKMGLIVSIYMRFNPFTYINVETPRLWTYLSQNKLTSSLMIFFIANSIESNMMSTGAFEILYNDMPIWSKIQTGRMPSAPELLQAVHNQLSLGKQRMPGDIGTRIQM